MHGGAVEPFRAGSGDFREFPDLDGLVRLVGWLDRLGVV
jgi:hypothetical protein